MRLSYGIELVIATAVALALVRVAIHDNRDSFDLVASCPKWVQYGTTMTVFGDPLCTGLALVEGVAVWVEAARRRPARVWGIGRLTWSLALVFVMLASVHE